MSLLNWTLTPAVAAVAGDTAVPALGDGILLGHARKVLALPAARLIAGFTGQLWPGLAWFRALEAAPPAGLDEAAADAARRLPALAAEAGRAGAMDDEARSPFAAVLLGWSTASGRVVGWSFRAETGHRGEAEPDGHAMGPPPGATGGEARRLRRLADAALAGRGVAAFHRALALHQAGRCRTGAYPGAPATCVGGTLWLARAGEGGAWCRALGALPP